MNKNERKSTLKGILKNLKSYKEGIVEISSELIEGVGKVEELYDFLDSRCILPNDWDFQEMQMNMIREYYENDDTLSGIIGSIEDFCEEVYETLSEMKDGDRKDEWSEFFDVLDDAKLTIDISEIEDIDGLENQIDEAICMLEGLL